MTAEQLADPTKTAELEFVKGHEKSSLFKAGAENFFVCTDETCRHTRYYVALLWATADVVTRKVPVGDVVIMANADAGVYNMHKTCNMTVRFPVESAHAYQVKLANNFDAAGCVLTVQDKATGAFLRLHRLDHHD